MVDSPNLTIDSPQFRARDCYLLKSDQSPIHSDQSPDPCEDVSDLSHTPTNSTEQRDEDPPPTQ
ncbi:unnamed protein product [Prunus brigantina]